MTPNQDCHCPRTTHYHGTRNNYLTHACRCKPCTDDATRERDKIRRLQAYGRPHPHKIDATPARRHALKLIRNGMSISELARAANLSHPAISRLIGSGKQQPSKQIINTTAERILNIGHNTQPTEGQTSSLGTIRRIQALAANGYPLQQQGRLAGIHPDKPRHVLQQQQTDAHTAKAIAQLFTRLQLTPNPHPSPQATQARNTARRNGWLPPMAWDEDLIDHPAHKGHPMELAA